MGEDKRFEKWWDTVGKKTVSQSDLGGVPPVIISLADIARLGWDAGWDEAWDDASKIIDELKDANEFPGASPLSGT